MIRVKVFLTVIICILLIVGCEMINMEQGDLNIDFCKFDNLQEVYYEYGQNNNRKKYKYNLITDTTKEVDMLQNIESVNETFVDEKTGDEYCFSYHMSKHNTKVNDGIRHINKKNKIDEVVLSIEEIEKQYHENKFGIYQLTYSSDLKKLLFSFKDNGYSTLMVLNLEKQELKHEIKYNHKYYLNFYNTEYAIINDKVFVIDLNSQICIYDISKDKLLKTDCFAYNFVVSENGDNIYFIDLKNNLCIYDINNNVYKEVIHLKSRRVEWIDVDKSNNYLLLVESLEKGSLIGSSTSSNFKQNELNIYEISTGNKKNLVKPSLFNVLFKAHFID